MEFIEVPLVEYSKPFDPTTFQRKVLKSKLDLDLLRKMASEIRTQDNRMTSEPMFCVQVEGPLCSEDDGDYIWQTEQTFFTAVEAETYRRNIAQNVGPDERMGPRIYVESGNNNPEWCAVRALLLALFPEEVSDER